MIDLPQDFDATQLTDAERAVLEEYARRKQLRKNAQNLLHYIRHRAPWFMIEEFHILIAEKFMALFNGDIDRLMIFAAPRAGKSQMTSIFLPEWWAGLRPQDQILLVSYASDLATKFGRQIKNTIQSNQAYHEMFPETTLSSDSKASDRWGTTKGGEFNAAGAGTGIAGKGFHLGLIDDPISEQDAPSKTKRRNVNEWYGPGFLTRQMPERNAVVITQTRWAVDDLSGDLLAKAVTEDDADVWEVLKIPAIIDEATADELNRIAATPEYQEFLITPNFPEPFRYESGGSFAPRRRPLAKLKRIMANLNRKDRAALYMQSPIVDGGGIIKREHWKPWSKTKALPQFDYVLQSYDTALEPEEANDYTARTTWGIFKREDDGIYCAMVVERMKERLEFPDLRVKARDAYKEYRPDRVIIEKKASGHSLIQELRRLGIPVTGVPAKGSKEMRANVATILFEQGVVYYPEGKQWAEEVIGDCEAFPNGDHDDLVDSVVHALLYLRKHFHLDTPADNPDEEDDDNFDSTPVRSYARRHGNYARST